MCDWAQVFYKCNHQGPDIRLSTCPKWKKKSSLGGADDCPYKILRGKFTKKAKCNGCRKKSDDWTDEQTFTQY